MENKITDIYPTFSPTQVIYILNFFGNNGIFHTPEKMFAFMGKFAKIPKEIDLRKYKFREYKNILNLKT